MVVMDSGQKGSSRTCSSHHAIFIGHSVVCMPLGQFGHVGGFLWVPKCFPQRNTLSRIQDRNVSDRIPSVKGFQLLHILLHYLSPPGVGL